jgi:ABC-type spermidine/putrescine transport system permease subunit II
VGRSQITDPDTRLAIANISTPVATTFGTRSARADAVPIPRRWIMNLLIFIPMTAPEIILARHCSPSGSGSVSAV